MPKISLQFFYKKRIIAPCILLFMGIVLFFFRFSALQFMSTILIKEDEIHACDAIFVLSGNAMDRAAEAAKLYKLGIGKKIICTGGNQLSDFKILGLKELESDMSRLRLLQLNIPDSVIDVIHNGSSTFEEAEVIKLYCDENNINAAVIVSSAFHTRRVHSVMHKRFLNSNTQIIIRAAESQTFNINEWWKNEYGLLAVYDEYVKLGYYFLKH
jgi:uncharacterized SAM-binding protein YcdF (DUF218 family)